MKPRLGTKAAIDRDLLAFVTALAGESCPAEIETGKWCGCDRCRAKQLCILHRLSPRTPAYKFIEQAAESELGIN